MQVVSVQNQSLRRTIVLTNKCGSLSVLDPIVYCGDQAMWSVSLLFAQCANASCCCAASAPAVAPLLLCPPCPSPAAVLQLALSSLRLRSYCTAKEQPPWCDWDAQHARPAVISSQPS